MSATAIRGKDWVFNAFWAACGESNAPRCLLHIPVTSLWKDGKPFKTLGTDAAGVVGRIILEDISIERSHMEKGFRGEAFKLINALRKLLLEYSMSNGYGAYQEAHGNEPFLTNVFYLDGKMESVTLTTLDILLRNESWRKQVMIMQAYVPQTSLQIGNYSNAPQVRSKVTGVGTEAADNFTRAIAKYAERAYTISSDTLLNNNTNDGNSLERTKPITLKVVSMQCKFALDPSDLVVFLFCEYTSVEIENGRTQVEEFIAKEKEGRQTSAAQAVSSELKSLLLHAQKRGLGVEDSFAHFDKAGNGFIDADMLIDGLARLGIGVTYPVGEAVLEAVGGIGSTFVTHSEFEEFLQKPVDIDTFDRSSSRTATAAAAGGGGGGRTSTRSSTTHGGGSSSGSGVRKRSAATAASASASASSTGSAGASSSSPQPKWKKKSAPGGSTSSSGFIDASVSPPHPAARGSPQRKKVLSQLLPPVKDSRYQRDFMDLQASQSYEWQTFELNVAPRSSQQQRPDFQSVHAPDDAFQYELQEQEQEQHGMELPLPVESYSTTTQAAASSAAAAADGGSGGGGVRGLPTWASKRSHRALKQLSKAQERWHKKQQVQEGSGSLRDLHSLDQNSMSSAGVGDGGAGETGGGLGAVNARMSSAGAPSFPSSPPRPRSGLSSQGSKRDVLSSAGSAGSAGIGATMNASTAASKVEPLSLQGIVHKMNDDLNKDADELLHVDHGVIMTYRLLNGAGPKADELKTHEKTASLRYKSILQERERNMSKLDEETHNNQGSSLKTADGRDSNKNDTIGVQGGQDFLSGVDAASSTAATATATGGELEAAKQSFTLVVVPDLFSTLEALQQALEAILFKYPYAQIVLVGLPGLPHTVWPAAWILNKDLHARSIAKLLKHLVDTGRIHSNARAEAEAPVFFMGIGNGCCSLTQFLTQFLPDIPELHMRARATCLVNGLLRHTKKYRSICRDLREAMLTASPWEVNELISSLHFFDDYLVHNGREKCIEKFWSVRRGLQMQRADEKGRMGFFGVEELLKGILISPDEFDGAELLVASQIPVLVVQSTEDLFVDPKNAALFRPEQLPPERRLVADISDALDPAAVHVSWLKAGHEVLQERNTFLLGFVSQLAQLSGIKPVQESAVINKASNKADDPDDLFDVLELASRGVKSDGSVGSADGAGAMQSPGGSVHSVAEGKDGAGSSVGGGGEDDEENSLNEEYQKEHSLLHLEEEERLERERQEAAEREAEAKQAEEEAQADREANLAEEERRAMKNRKAADKLKRAQLALERKKRELKLSRENHMQILYQREREEADRKAEGREQLKMFKEDERSKFAAEYEVECQIAEMSKRLAKARADELAAYRKDEAIKRVEEKMARERAARIEERRQRAAELVKNIRREELVLSGEREGGYDMPENKSAVQFVIEASNRLMRDLLECRAKGIEALKRQKIVQEKTDLFRKQLATVENDERRLRRAIRLIEINPSVVGSEMNAESQLADLKRSLEAKQETLEEMTALSRQREEQLDAANASAQALKIAMQDRDELMKQRVEELHLFENELSTRHNLMKMNKEHFVVIRDRKRVLVLQHQKRMDTVEKELIRVRAEKGKLIDTDVWVAGVMQRCVTKELKVHLKKELKIAREARDQVLEELSRIRNETFDLMEKMAKTRRDLSKITQVTKVLYKTYKKFSSVSIQQIMDALEEREKRAENLEKRRAKENDIERVFTRAGSTSIVDRVRLKESDIRSKDERQFVGIDLVMNPEAYLHISVVEAEQMQFDEDYHCPLSKSDLERIVKLPDQISLALPFLHTESEVNVHRLLNIFLKEKGEKHFRDRDYLGAGAFSGMKGAEDASEVSDDVSFSTKGDMTFMGAMPNGAGAGTKEANAVQNAAEVMHDTVCRESLRNRLRGMAEDEPLTPEEHKWRIMDKVLSPHVYDLFELEQDVVHIRTIDNTLSTSVQRKAAALNKHDPNTQKLKPGDRAVKKSEEDLFEGIRTRFAEGEDVFEYEWKCPFTKEKLLHLRTLPLDAITDPDEVEARTLMDKYYVDDNESIMGLSTLQLIEKMSARVVAAITAADRDAEREVEMLVSQQRKAEDDDASLASNEVDGVSRKHGEVASGDKAPPTANLFGGPDDENGVGEAIPREWGSFNEVHPASAGKDSQTSYFHLSTFDASRDHPACFAQHTGAAAVEEEDLSDDEDTEGAVIAPVAAGADDETDLFMSILGGGSAHNSKGKSKRHNDPHSHFHICESISELALSDGRKLRGKIVLLQQKEPLVLLDEKNATLQARQSRSHYFTLPTRDSIHALDITVSVVFKGDFGGKGYKPGRIAGGLFRLPPESETGVGPSAAGAGAGAGGGAPRTGPVALPESVGYAPYNMQSPNLPDSIGRLVILHRPKQRPMPSGTFQLVLGAASNTKYSVEVTCTVAKMALPIVDEAICEAKLIQGRLPIVLAEVESIEESIRLAERKLLVCQEMTQEAELESERNRKGMRIISKKLEQDDEEMTLMEDDRRNLQRELSIFEIEYAQWAHTYATRNREQDDIREGLRMMYNFKREKLKEKDKIKSDLEGYRRDLPACMIILRNTAEAVQTAMSLNTIVHGVTEETTAATIGDFGGIQVSTPAEDVRRHIKQYGFNSLSLEEQQWCILDQALNPGKYEWMRELEEKERTERERMGKPPKVEKFNAALEEFRLSKVEIEYIMDTPFSMLTRKEVIARKLLTKFHDDKEALRKAIAAVAYSFDPHLAERVRSKNAKGYTKEEAQWSSVDRILHPEIWQFYVNRSDNFLDRHEKEAGVANKVKKHKSKKPKSQKRPTPAAENPTPAESGNRSTLAGLRSFFGKSKSSIKTTGSTSSIKQEGEDDAGDEEEGADNGAGAHADAGDGAGKRSKNLKRGKSVSSSKMASGEEDDDDDHSHDGDEDSEGDYNPSGEHVKSGQLSAEEAVLFQQMRDHVHRNTKEGLMQARKSRAASNIDSRKWQCPFDKDNILRIWRTPRHFLQSDDERHVFKLLQKYNGSYTSYMDAIAHAKRRHGHFVKEGSHIQWDKLGQVVSKDVDFRARQLLREIDRATFTKNEWIHSDVLHANDQKFPTRVLRMHLEEALDTLLVEQIRDRERAEKHKVDSSDSEDEDEAALLLAFEQDDEEVLEDSDDAGGEGAGGNDAEVLNKVQKRARRREKRKRKLIKLSEEQQVQKAKKMLANKKTGTALAEALLQEQLGLNGCLACRTRRCRWEPSVDEQVCLDRKNVLDGELERIRLDRDSMIFESDIVLSVQLGGNRVFKRQDLLEELTFEQRELSQRIDLNHIDKELHDAYATRKETFECKYLHGYSLLMWTNNARQALEARHSRLCALSVSKEVVDDILDWMLEGWYFGERESQFRVLGKVPTIKKDGMIRAGQDQISSVTQVVSKMKDRADKRRKNIITAENRQGQMIEKAWEVEQKSQQNIEKLKVARDGNEHEHMLNEVETTLKFGIFMMTVMYFRAMTYLRREQKSWSGAGEDVGVKDKFSLDKIMTDDRMRMIDEENRAAARKKKIDIVLARCKVGEQRRIEREAQERREAILRMQAIVRRQRLELDCVSTIQKVYRGHIGRKAARRWALKRAELGAMNALLNSTAIAIQRIYRGYAARLFAVQKRTEMAQFIALMRVQESQQDEEIYWQTHPWSRFKKNRREWLKAKMEEYQGGSALGASRLTAAEQAELEGKTLEQIKRELQGLEDEDEEEEEDDDDDQGGDETSAALNLSSKYGGSESQSVGDNSEVG